MVENGAFITKETVGGRLIDAAIPHLPVTQLLKEEYERLDDSEDEGSMSKSYHGEKEQEEMPMVTSQTHVKKELTINVNLSEKSDDSCQEII